MPRQKSSSFADDLAAVSQPSTRSFADDLVEVSESTQTSAATPPPSNPSLWTRANTPLWEGPSRGAKRAADWFDPVPSDEQAHPVRAFVAGSMEGAGHVLSSLTSPVQLGLLALTGGANIWAKGATEGVMAVKTAQEALVAARAAGKVEEIATLERELASALKFAERNRALAETAHRVSQAGGAGFVASGAERVVHGETATDKLMGVAEVAGGLLGVKHGQRAIGKVRGIATTPPPTVTSPSLLEIPGTGVQPPPSGDRLAAVLEDSLSRSQPGKTPLLVKPGGERIPAKATTPPPQALSSRPLDPNFTVEPPEIVALRKRLKSENYPQSVIDTVVAKAMAGETTAPEPGRTGTTTAPQDISALPSLDERMAADKARREAAAAATAPPPEPEIVPSAPPVVEPPAATPPPLAASIGDRVRAQPVKRNRTTKGGGEGVVQVPYEHASDMERLGLGQMLIAMESSEFTPKTFLESGRGKGGSPEVLGGAAGHPVYYDIVGGSPEGSPPTYKYSRGEVAAKLRQFLDTGKRSVVSDLAIERIRSGHGHAAGDVPWDMAKGTMSRADTPPPDVTVVSRRPFAQPDPRPKWQAPRRLGKAQDVPPAQETQTPGPQEPLVTAGQDSSPVWPSGPPSLEETLWAQAKAMPDDELRSMVRILREAGEGVEDRDVMLAVAEQELTTRPPAPETPVDVLPTGEEQPRLPGAEGVRDAEQPTPTFEAPFALDRETAPAPPPKAPGLPLGDVLRMDEDELAAILPKPKRSFPFNEGGEAFPPNAATPPPEPQGPLPKYAGNINLNRIDTTDGVKRTILKVSEDFAGQIDEARRGTISRQATRQLADELGMTVGDLLKRRKGQAFNAEEALAAREIHAASANEVYAKAETLRSAREAGVSQDAIDGAYKDLVDSLKRHVAIQTQVGGMTAEAGRALGIFNEPVTGTGDLKALKALIDDAGGTGKLDAIAEGLVRIGPDAAGASRFVRQALKAKTIDKIYEVWLNGILSGPVTHSVNIVSNTLTTLTKPLEAVASGSVDAARALVRGTPRQRYVGEATMHLLGLTKGMRDGVRAGLRSFETERPVFGATKMTEFGPQRHAIPGKVGRAVRIPTRALAAEDEFFKAIVYSMEEHGLAYRQATREGLRGITRAQRIVRLLADPTPEMTSGAAKDALYRTFNADLVKTKGLLQLRRDLPGARWVLPFIRTPINIVSYGVERTPLMWIKVMRDLGRGTLDPGTLSDEAAKAVMGTALALGVGSAVADGLITGGGPTSPAERRTLEATGWLPYAVKVNGQHYQYGRLEPLGVSIGLVADFVEIAKSTDREEIPAKVLKSLQQNFTNKTFVKGLADVLNAVSDPDQGATWVQRMAGSFVPSAVATTARALDPVRRDPEGFGETFKARLPGLSSQVPPRLDIQGHPLTARDTAVERFVSPVRRLQATDDPVADTLVRLKVPLSAPSDRLTLPGGKALSRSDSLALQEARGQEVYARLSREIARGGFSRRSEEEQIRRINAIKRAASVDVSERARRLSKRGQPLTVEGLVMQARRAAVAPPTGGR